MFWKENGKMFVIIPFFVRSPSPALRSSTHSTWCCSTRSTQCRTWRSSRFCRSPPSPPVLATSPLKQFTRWFVQESIMMFLSNIAVLSRWVCDGQVQPAALPWRERGVSSFSSSVLCEMSFFLLLSMWDVLFFFCIVSFPCQMANYTEDDGIGGWGLFGRD